MLVEHPFNVPQFKVFFLLMFTSNDSKSIPLSVQFLPFKAFLTPVLKSIASQRNLTSRFQWRCPPCLILEKVY
jgi:hypothetical protein